MAEPGLSELITTTLRNRQEVLRDNVRNNNAVLMSMDEYGGIELEDGGRTIIEEMAYTENGTITRYDGGQPISTAYNATMTAAEFEWKQLGGSIVITGKEKRMNAGQERSIKLVSNRTKILEYTLNNTVNSDLLSAGTADGGKQMGGLALLVSKTPSSGTVGGIDVSSSGGAFYRNLAVDTTTAGPDAGSVTSASNIKDRYTYMIVNLTRGTDKPKLILAGSTHYRALMSSLQAIQRIADTSKLGKAGFTSMDYMGVPVVLGGGVSFGGESLVQDDLSYFLNTEFLKLRVHRDAYFEPLPQVQSINQDAEVAITVFMGNMTTSARKLQGVLFDS